MTADPNGWTIVLATLFGGLGGAAVERLVSLWRRPRLKIITDVASDVGCRTINITASGGRAVHLRARIANRGRGTAHGAIIYFYDISVFKHDGTQVDFLGDVLSGEWAHEGKKPLNIPSRFDGLYVDLFATFADASGNLIGQKLCGQNQGNLLHNEAAGMRRLNMTIVVAGDDFTATFKRVSLSWDGSFQGLDFGW